MCEIIFVMFFCIFGNGYVKFGFDKVVIYLF